MSIVPLLRPLCVLAAAALFTGCAGYPPKKPFFQKFGILGFPFQLPERPLPTRADDFWEDPGGRGAPMIVVKLGEQRAYFYRGRTLVGATRISSGRSGFRTPPGHYSVIQKDRHHVSNLYGDFVDAEGAVVQRDVDTSKDKRPEGAIYRGAKMPYFLRFRGGYGLHAGRVPNYPASHGCVRLPSTMARHFFENAAMGTPLIVEG